MSLNLNQGVWAGRLVRDPELRTTTSGLSVTTFTVAIDRRYKKGDEKQSDFLDCVAWRDRADFIAKYFKKGSAICVTGSVQTRTYEDNNGNKRKDVKINVDEADFVESKGNAQQTDQPNPPAAPSPSAPQQMSFENIVDDDDLPF